MCRPVTRFPPLPAFALAALLILFAAPCLAAADDAITSIPTWVFAALGSAVVAGTTWGMMQRAVSEQGNRIVELCALVLRLESALAASTAAAAQDRISVALASERISNALRRIEDIESQCDQRHDPGHPGHEAA